MPQNKKILTQFIGLLCLSLIACLTNAAGESSPSERGSTNTSSAPVRFAVISDMPYDEAQERMLNLAINPKLDEAGFPFILHLGDFKTQAVDCTPENDKLFKQWLTERRSPVLYTPGDNEWADCDYPPLETPVSELERLKTIRKEFFNRKFDAPQLSIKQQQGQPENQSWVVASGDSNIVFGSLHVIGSKNGRYGIHQDDPEAVIRQIEQRNGYNKLWLEEIFERAKKEKASAVIIAQHGDPSSTSSENKPCTTNPGDLNCDPYYDLKNQLADKAQQFPGPVLLMHGDTSPVCLEAAFHNTPNLWRFNSTGDGALIDAAVIEVTPNSAPPFKISSLVWGLIPGSCKN